MSLQMLFLLQVGRPYRPIYKNASGAFFFRRRRKQGEPVHMVHCHASKHYMSPVRCAAGNHAVNW